MTELQEGIFLKQLKDFILIVELCNIYGSFPVHILESTANKT